MVETNLNAPPAREDPNLTDEAANSSLPSVRAAMALGATTGEMDSTDLKIPYLSIAYGVGKLSVKYNPGDWVLAGEHLIGKKGVPLRIVIISSVKYYKERLSREDFAAGMRPRSFMTREEVLAHDGTLEWRNDPGEPERRLAPSFGPAMDMKILIEKPADLEPSVFGLCLDGKQYAPAYFSVDKSGYNRVGKEVHTSSSLALKEHGLLGGVWELWTDSQLINGNNTIVPLIKLKDRTTDTFRKEVAALFGAV